MQSTATDPGQLSAIYDVARLLASSQEPALVLERVMDAVVSVTGAERGFLLLNEPDGSLNVAVARNGHQDDLRHPGFGPSRTVIDFVAETGEAQVIDDALTDNRTAASESVGALRLRSIVCVPLKIAGETLGVIYLDHGVETGRFGRTGLRLLEVVAQQAAVAVHGARLREQAHSTTGRIDKLALYQDEILRSISTAVVTLDPHGRVQHANHAAEELFQVAAQQSMGHAYRTLTGEPLGDALLPALKAAAAGKASAPFEIESAVCGAPRFLRCLVSPVPGDGGDVGGIVVLIDDQTARVTAERSLESEEAEHRRVRELFSKYVPEAVVKKLVENPNESPAGVAQREVSVLFADIRGYTTLSERSSPERLLVTLSRYLTVATNCVMEQHGTLDKFMGDGVMAVFNAPVDLPDHPLAALKAAWAMQRRAARFMEGVSFGVGVNTGTAIVGNIGTDQIRNYSCIGDVVNVASRLQGHAEGGHIIITRSTYDRVHQHVRVQPLGGVVVKGRAMAVEAFQVLAVS